VVLRERERTVSSRRPCRDKFPTCKASSWGLQDNSLKIKIVVVEEGKVVSFESDLRVDGWVEDMRRMRLVEGS